MEIARLVGEVTKIEIVKRPGAGGEVPTKMVTIVFPYGECGFSIEGHDLVCSVDRGDCFLGTAFELIVRPVKKAMEKTP